MGQQVYEIEYDPDGAPLTPAELAFCSVIGLPTDCDALDWVILARAIERRAPGVSPVCPGSS